MDSDSLMSFLLFKKYKPYGILTNIGQVHYFDHQERMGIESLDFYKRRHSTQENLIVESISEVEKPSLLDIIHNLQLRGLTIIPITSILQKEIKEEIDKL